MAVQQEKWEIAISGRQMDSVRKKTPVVLTTGAQSSSSTSKAPTQTEGRYLYRNGSLRGASLSD